MTTNPDDRASDDDSPSAGRARRGWRPRRPTSVKQSLVYLLVAFLVGVLMTSIVVAMAANAAGRAVGAAIEDARPLGPGGLTLLEGQGTYLLVGPSDTRGNCTVTGPDGSSAEFDLSVNFALGEIGSLASFATGSDGEYLVECAPQPAATEIRIAQSPALGAWGIFGLPMLIGIVSLLFALILAFVGLTGLVEARRRRWQRPD